MFVCIFWSIPDSLIPCCPSLGPLYKCITYKVQMLTACALVCWTLYSSAIGIGIGWLIIVTQSQLHLQPKKSLIEMPAWEPEPLSLHPGLSGLCYWQMWAVVLRDHPGSLAAINHIACRPVMLVIAGLLERGLDKHLHCSTAILQCTILKYCLSGNWHCLAP